MTNIFKPLRELSRNINTLKKNKVYFLILCMIIFSLLYLFLDDKHFSGVNKYRQEIRNEVVKDIVKKELVENFSTIEDEKDEEGEEKNTSLKTDVAFKPLDPIEFQTQKEEKIIDKETKKAKKDVFKTDITIESLKPTLMQSLYNRLYFSISTGTLLGYGDIVPITNTSKLLSMIQSICTIALILA